MKTLTLAFAGGVMLLGFNITEITDGKIPDIKTISQEESRSDGDEIHQDLYIPKDESKVSRGEFTAYTPSPDETWGNPFITADGTDKREFDGCIVAHKNLPFGARIYIPYLETICEVRDRMPQKSKADFDIFMDTKSEALQFGRRVLDYHKL